MSLFNTGIFQEFLTSHQDSTYTFQIILSATGAGTFEVPIGVYEITVECWGGGAAGLGSIDSGSGGGGVGGLYGGGGGGYAKKVYSVNQGDIFSYNIGAGGSASLLFNTINYGGSGGTTWFGANGVNIGTATIRAMGGGGGGSPTTAPGTTVYGGGSGNLAAWLNVGDVTYAGGNGATGTLIVPYKTGGGGAGAGSTAIGNFGSQNDGLGTWASGGTATASLGGAGGLGFYLKNELGPQNYGDGTAGYNYGAGGGGSGRYAAGQTVTILGGAGAQGLIIISCKR